MTLKRREFLKISGAATAGLSLSGVAGNSLLSALTQDEDAKKMKNFGVNLWTLREDLPKDPKATLKQLASFGYKHIESFEGNKGIFWGMTNKEFKTYLTDLGMTMDSTHYGSEKDFEKKVNDLAEIGVKYITLAWEGPGKTIDDYKKMADDFNKKGELCKKSGLRYAFHNHQFTFVPLSGQYAQDVLLADTDPSLVDFEMDIYWVVTAGQDPEVWFNKYPNRFRLCHVKDRIKGSKEDFASCTLGEGSIDFAKVLKTARKTGMQYFIVEQERYDGTTPLKAVEANAAYMKKLSI